MTHSKIFALEKENISTVHSFVLQVLASCYPKKAPTAPLSPQRFRDQDGYDFLMHSRAA